MQLVHHQARLTTSIAVLLIFLSAEVSLASLVSIQSKVDCGNESTISYELSKRVSIRLNFASTTSAHGPNSTNLFASPKSHGQKLPAKDDGAFHWELLIMAFSNSMQTHDSGKHRMNLAGYDNGATSKCNDPQMRDLYVIDFEFIPNVDLDNKFWPP